MTNNIFISVIYLQACTGIDDVGEAIYHLDETNWDLLVRCNNHKFLIIYSIVFSELLVVLCHPIHSHLIQTHPQM